MADSYGPAADTYGPTTDSNGATTEPSHPSGLTYTEYCSANHDAMKPKQWNKAIDTSGLEPTKPKGEHFIIPPMSVITGAQFEGGKWIPTGGGIKRKRFEFDDIEDADEDSLKARATLRNPKKKTKFNSAVEKAEIEYLAKMVKYKKPPRNVNPVALLQASEMAAKLDRQQKKAKRNGLGPSAENPDGSPMSKGLNAAMDILSMAGRFTVSNKFDELPISQYTKWCLKKNGFKYLTDIQKAAIPHALVGRDVLGAAKTGSGKTLSFVVPMLDNLYRKAWSFRNGLGALVLAPTRELALQIFNS